MSPAMETRAYLIRNYAHPREWDVTYAEIAEATGLTHNQVHNTINAKKWGGRILGGIAGLAVKATKARMFQKSIGSDIDENMLDIVDLMR